MATGYYYISSGTANLKSSTSDVYYVYGSGRLIISSGGTTPEVHVGENGPASAYGGYVEVLAHGLISSGSVENGGSLIVSDGGSITRFYFQGGYGTLKTGAYCYKGSVLSGGELYAFGAVALNISVGPGGSFFLYNESSISSGIISGYATGTNVSSGGTMYVGSGASAVLNHISAGGFVYLNGVAESSFVNGIMIVSSNGHATENYVSSGGLMYVYGDVSSSYIRSGGEMRISSGGTARKTNISSGGSMAVFRNGIALEGEIVGGTAYVYSGGSASGFRISSGIMWISSGGTASGTIMSGGDLRLDGSSCKGVYTGGKVIINGGGYSENEKFNSGEFYVFGTGSATGSVCSGTIGSGVTMNISGGRFDGSTVSNAIINVTTGFADLKSLNGAVANIKGGSFYASGGIMSSATIAGYGSSRGQLYVMSGATVNKADVNVSGRLWITSGGSVGSATAGVSSGSDSASIGVSGGGKLGSAFIKLGGNLDVGTGGSVNYVLFSGGGKGQVLGTINFAAINSGSPVQVSHGGLVSNASVSSKGELNINGGFLSTSYISGGGSLTVKSGGTARSATVYGSAVVDHGGNGLGMDVCSGGRMTISENGVVTGFTVSDGAIEVLSGGTLTNGLVSAGGSVALYDSALAFSCTVSRGGVMEISRGAAYATVHVKDGGKITGDYNCGYIIFSSGANADIDIFNISAGNTYAPVSGLVNAMNKGVVFSLTTSVSQSKGTYKLATDAAGFQETITVQNVYGNWLGTLTVGQTVNIGRSGFTLNLDGNNVLSVTVGDPIHVEREYFPGCFAGGIQSMLAVESEGVVRIYSKGSTWGAGIVLDPGWDVIATGDFNADGRDDFLRVNDEGYVVGEMANDNGTFSPQVLNFKGAGWNILGTGNFDGVGPDDVLVANPTAASETVGLLGYWKGGTEWTLINGYSPEWECVSTGDFNGDGKCDMLWRNSFEGEGGLTYNAYCTWIVDDPVDWRMVSVANPDEWNFLCSGDFDGNGSHDIAMINGEGVVGIWGVSDGYLSSWSILSAVNTAEWELAGVGDFNGDGTDDIAWCSNVSNLAGYWKINDKTLTNWINIAQIS